jgi:hypothetical protein
MTVDSLLFILNIFIMNFENIRNVNKDLEIIKTNNHSKNIKLPIFYTSNHVSLDENNIFI